MTPAEPLACGFIRSTPTSTWPSSLPEQALNCLTFLQKWKLKNCLQPARFASGVKEIQARSALLQNFYIDQWERRFQAFPAGWNFSSSKGTCFTLTATAGFFQGESSTNRTFFRRSKQGNGIRMRYGKTGLMLATVPRIMRSVPKESASKSLHCKRTPRSNIRLRDIPHRFVHDLGRQNCGAIMFVDFRVEFHHVHAHQIPSHVLDKINHLT